VGIFAATFLMLALGRWGKVPVPRGVSALVGGLATALLYGVGPGAIDVQVLALLAGLMVLAGVAGHVGLFGPVGRALARRSPRGALLGPAS
jgi:Na+/H+ antiporter NhaD/arsenite permease-like protein